MEGLPESTDSPVAAGVVPKEQAPLEAPTVRSLLDFLQTRDPNEPVLLTFGTLTTYSILWELGKAHDYSNFHKACVLQIGPRVASHLEPYWKVKEEERDSQRTESPA